MIPSAALVVIRFVVALVRLGARAWPGRGARAAAWAALIACAACGGWTPAAATPLTWNPAADFYATTGNPNGVWSYGWMDTGFKTFTPYVNKHVNPAGYSNWYGWAGDETPAVGYTGPTTPLNIVPPGTILLHPGNGNEPSVLRWTAPFAATIRVVGQFYAGDSGVMQVAVRHNNSALFTASDAGAFDLTVTVAVGDTLDFAAYDGYAYGSTGLAATLTTLTVSLPLTTGEGNKLSLGAYPAGTRLRISASGKGDLANSNLQTNPDGSLAAAAGAPWSAANGGAAYPGVSGFPAGDGFNRFVGGGMNYDQSGGSGWMFAGKQTTDTTDAGAIRAGAVVGTFVASPTRADWFLIGNGATAIVPSGGATLYVAVNESNSSDNHGAYALTVAAPTPTALDGFAPNAGGGNANVTQVLAAAVQPDGKIIIGGNFTTLQPAGTAVAVAASRLARLNRDGSIDFTFSATASAEVNALAIQPDGKILVGGGGQINGVSSNGLTRLNANGSRDTTFSYAQGGSLYRIVVLPDGKLLVAGGFPNGSIRYPVLRLLADGSLDPAFTRVPITGVLSATLTWAYDVAVQADGKMLVGGYFWTIGGQGIRMLARLNADGTLDPSFDAGLTHNNGPEIKRIVFQPDGKILIAGRFASVAGQSWAHFARLHANGTLDTTFSALSGVNFSGMADCALQADGRIVVVGGFNALHGFTRSNLVRLLPDGTVDPTLTGGVGNTSVEFPTVLVAQPDGSVLVGGGFATLGGLPLGRLARIQPDGSVERSVALDATSDVVGAFALQPNGKLILGGHFNTVGGVARPFVARLNADATLDTAFNPAPDASVVAPVVLADGRFLLGGRFSTIGGQARNGLARFSADGVIDPSFNAAISGGALNSVALQSDGKIVIGGYFTSVGGQPRNRLARLHADGSLDLSFDPDVKGDVYGLALQGDGSIVFSGDFTQVGGTSRNRLARVNSAGVLDAAFDPSANNTVYALAVQADGKLLVAGTFSTIAGETRAGYARLTATGAIDAEFNPATTAGGVTVVQADGKILVGGGFTSMAGSTRGYLARLLATGALDADFDVAADGNVGALALQADGKLFVGGDFSTIGGESRRRLARLNSTGPTATALTATTSTVTLTRTGPLPELAWVTLEKSTDRSTWTPLGTATRLGTTANWQLAGQSLPLDTIFYLRARAAAPTGVYGASSLEEHVRQIFIASPAPVIASTTPLVLGSGVPVTITGANFAGATAVRFNGVNATSFTVDSPTQITAIVPSGVTAGAITVASPSGSGASPSNYTTTTAPIIVSLNPASGTVGRTITILGGNFGTINNSNTPAVSFNGVAATAQRQSVPGGFRVTVPSGATTGPITVTVSGTPVVSSTFTVLTSGTAPANDDFANAQVLTGPSGVIEGSTAFATRQTGEPTLTASGARSVWFSWVAPSSGAFLFDQTGSEFGAYVGVYTGSAVNALTSRALGEQPNTFAFNYAPAAFVATAGVTYFIAVDGYQGTSGNFRLTWSPLAAPAIASFTPSSAYAGSAMTITGANFTRGATVTVGGVAVAAIPSSATTLTIAALPSVTVAGPVVVTTVGGTATSAGNFTVSAPPAGGGRALVNLSLRSAVSANGLHANFMVEGSTAKTVLVRAVGPTLGSFGISGVLADPKIEIFNGQGQSVAVNDDWAGASAIVSATTAIGAFALNSGSKDAAILATLNPGTYSVRVDGVGATTGEALLEIYDSETSLRIPYLAVRPALNSAGVGVAGFVFTGSAQRLLFRAVGPALLARGVAGAHTNPTLSLYKGSQLIGSNDNWGNATANPALVSAAASAGLFSLADGSNDAALLVDLVAGAYTVQVAGVGAAAGLVQIEIAQIDSARAESFPPALTGPPPSAALVLGGSVTFAAPALGNPAPTYQWLRAGAPITAATNVTLALTNLQNSDAANYTVALTNSAGTTTSAAYVLSPPTSTTTPAVVASVTPVAVSAGGAVTITGSGFTGATMVAFNGVSASFVVVSDSTLTAFVPAGATTGPVTVSKPAPAGTGATGVTLTINAPTNTLLAELVTRVPSGTTASHSMSAETAISGDGRYVAFASDSLQLVTGLVNSGGNRHVCRWDRTTGLLQLVSRVAGTTTTVGNGYAERPLLSNDGRYVAYVSSSSNHVAGQTGVSGNNIFLFDAQTGVTTLVSHTPGQPANTLLSDGTLAGLSDDGRYVFFGTSAGGVIPGLSNPGFVGSLYRWDRVTDTTLLVSHVPGSVVTAANNHTYTPLALSGDGRYVAFSSLATDLVPGQVDTNGAYDVFLRDCQTDVITLVTRTVSSATTTAASGGSLYNPGRVSDDGRTVAFYSGSTDLVSGFTYRSTENLYLFNTATGSSTLVTRGVGTDAAVALGSAADFVLSADGRYLVYKSGAPDLVPAQVDTNGLPDLFVFDRVTAANTLISRAAGTVTTTPTYGISQPGGYPLPVTRNARYAAFSTVSANLVAGVTPTPNNDEDVYVADLQTGVIALASRKVGGGLVEAGGTSVAKLMAADAPIVLFGSMATTLVAGNSVFDTEQLYVFEADLVPPSLALGAPSASTTVGTSISYPVTYGDAAAITLSPGHVVLAPTGTAAATVTVSGSGLTTRTITLSGFTGVGTLAFSILPGSATDLSGNPAPGAGPAATVGVATVAPLIATQPAPFANAAPGGSVTLTLAATSPNSGTLTYQWRKFGQPVAGATNPSLTLANLALFDAGFYDVQVFNNGSPLASTATRVVVDAPIPAATVLTASAAFTPRFENDFAFFERSIRTADGKVYLSGNFSSLYGVLRPGFARLDAAGTLDTAFAPAPVHHSYYTPRVYAVAVQADGRVLIGGQFGTVGGLQRDGLARLNADGSVDPTFVPPAGLVNSDRVFALAVQPDGKIFAAGSFNDSGVNLVRLHADGSRDSTFVVGEGFNGTVYDLALQADGKLVVGGSFSAYRGSATGRLARLSATGVLDTAYETAGGDGFNATVRTLVLQPDGKLLVGGDFTSYGGSPRNRLVRLLDTGALDITFLIGAGFNDNVAQLALQSDGAVIAVGDFSTFNENTTKGIARLTSAGGRDTTFVTSSELDASPGFNDGADGVALLANGVLVLSNDSNRYASPVANTGPLTRLTALGALDTAFAPAPRTAGSVLTLVPAPGGKWLVGGQFNRVNGAARGNLARLNSDYTLDHDFIPGGTGVGGTVKALAVQPDGKVLVGGAFATFNGLPANRLVRLTPAGPLDPTFDIGTGFNAEVVALALDASGRVLVGGQFTSFNGAARHKLLRLTAAGTLDPAFVQSGVGLGSSADVQALAALPDGRFYVGGSFSSYAGTACYNVARFLADGALDSAFASGLDTHRVNSRVTSLLVQPDGKLLLGGQFYAVGNFYTNGLARLNADASRDATFGAFETSGDITALHLQSDGRIVVAGQFEHYGYGDSPLPIPHLARVDASGVVEPAFRAVGFSGSTNVIRADASGALLLGGDALTFPGVTAAGLARLDPAVGPAIATAPVQQAVAVGAPASFSVAATGAGLAYQWTKDGVAVPGANGSSLVLAAAQTADAGHYAVTVKNLFGSVTSAPVLLTGPGTAPVISALASAPVTVGTTATLTVTATGATSYQWRKLGQPLSGATTATLTLPATALADAGLYDVLAYNGLTRTRSAVARLVVQPSGTIQNPLRVDRTFAGVLESAESYGVPAHLLAQPDGSYYVAGNFTSVDGAFRFNLARFSATGVLDPAFAPEVSGGNINALARQADGKLVLVGDFHRVNGIECHHIARLNTDGSLDTTFVHGPGTGTQESLHAVAIQADQKILIGGELTDYGETSSLKRLARLNSDGTLDTAFNSVLQDGFNDTVRAIAVHTDGRIYVVGDFTQFNQSTSANHLVALNADGSRFALPGIEAGAFAAEQTAIPALGSVSGADGVELTSLIVQPDGKLVVGGNFATFRNATARYLVGLAADGSADPSFINGSGAEGTVTRLLRQPDGMIYATGYFNTFDSRNARLVRLIATGAFDRSYSFDGTPTGLALGAANDLLVVGDFQTYYDSKTETSAPRSRFARFDTAGALTSAQVTRWGSFEGYVQTIIPAPGGKWLVAGYFRRLAGARVDYLARLNADGSFDSTFSTVQGPFNTPRALAVQGDGKILVGGGSEYWGNDEFHQRVGRLVRLHPDGTRDTSFNRGDGFNDEVSLLLVQPDGKILVGGEFTAFDGQPVGARLARLHADGTLDTSFLTGTGFDQSIRALALQSDDKLLVAGDFRTYHSPTNNVTFLVRLHANGVLDTAYAVSGDRVSAIAQQADGAFVIGGSFHSIAGQARSGVARLTSAGAVDAGFNPGTLFEVPEGSVEINALAVQPDGRVIVSGYFEDLAGVGGTGQLARLTPTGALDPSFRPYFGGSIYALTLRADGGLLLAGSELTANETYRQGLLALGGSTVTAAPVITTPPAAVVAASGTTAMFSVTAAGDGLTYQWRRYGVPIPGATNATLTLPAVTLASADVYDVVIANPTGAFVTSTPVPLAVSPVVTPGALVLDDRFDLPFERELSALDSAAVTQVQALPDGKFLVAGGFTRIGGVPRSRLARFNADGTVDLTFVPPAINYPVSRFVVQPDGKIVIAGDFYFIGSAYSGGLARLHADGALDAVFPSASLSNVSALALQSDGKILVGGQFSSIGGSLTRPGLARFTAAGVPDATFDAGLNPGAIVRALALQTLDSTEKILLGGTFTTVGGVTRNNLARVTLTGALDATFSAATVSNGPDGSVNAILAVDSAGAVVIGGAFTTVNGVAAPRLARLAAADGALDTAFLSSVGGTVNGDVHALALQPSGDLVVAGSFTAFSGGASRLRLARVSLGGLVDTAFAPTANSAVATLSLQADGAILLGGSFNEINGAPRQHLARLSSTGVADAAVDPALLAPAAVQALVHASGGGVLVGGSFTHVGGVLAPALVRLGAGGQLDPSFNAGGSGFPKGAVVSALAPVGDGRVTVIGSFASYNGTPRPNLLRLDASGALDSVFAPPAGPGGTPQALLALPGGRVLITGTFVTYNGVTCHGLAVLLNDASLDPTFAVPASQIPAGGHALARQPDGKILIGGDFTSYAGTAVNRLVRLNVDGTLDTAFLTAVGSGPNTAINTLQPLPDGRLIVAGGFTTWNGLVGSTYAVRLLSSGERDSGFQVQATGFGIVSLILQADGKLIERGLSSMSGTGPNSAFGFGRLDTAGSADNSFYVTGVVGFGSGDRAMLPLDDGTLLVAGNATLNLGGGFQRQGLARLVAFVGPAIVTPPVAQTAAAGGTATFSVVADGGAVNLYQWFRGTTVLAGATSPVLVLKNLTSADAGNYTVQITNARGTVTSTPVALTVNDLPVIVTPPVAQSAVFGGSATFSVIATGSPAPTFQWQRNGIDIPTATGAAYTITSATQDQAGTYRVVVTNSVGFVRSEPVEFAVVTRNLINFYARAIVAPRGSIVTSFTVEGAESKTVLLVGVGGTRASTATFSGGSGLAGIPAGSAAITPAGLADPRLVVVNAAGALIGSNDNWITTNVSALTAASTQVGATPGLTSTGEGANDAALLLTLAPGTYHVTLDSADPAGGAALLQVYDADTDGRPRLVMFTLRANVGSGDNVATAGFTVDGKLPKTVLIRALGEGLGASPGVLVDPVIELFRGSTFVARNDDTYFSSGSAIPAVVAQVGARPVSDSLDSTLVQTLDPGVYTVQLTPYYSGESGTVLFELFETDAQRAATLAPVITYLTPDQAAIQDRAARFGVVVVAKPVATYQWRKNGTPIDGAVHPVLTLGNVQSGDATTYDVVITSGASTITSQPRTLTILPEFHAADTDRDHRIGLLELTRIIQFYNHRVGTVRTGEYRTLADTEDGFTLGAGAITTHHSADSNRDGRIDIVELTRMIELFNHRSGTARTGEYHAVASTEDGFMPGPEYSEIRVPKIRR